MAEKALTSNYDSDAAALVVDSNCDKLVQSMDPVSSAPKLVSLGLISSQQAQDFLDDRVKTLKVREELGLSYSDQVQSRSHLVLLASRGVGGREDHGRAKRGP